MSKKRKTIAFTISLWLAFAGAVYAAVIQGGTSGSLWEVGVPSAGTLGANSAALVQPRPAAYGNLGHYTVTYAAVLANTQAANSRLFELRNTGTNLIVITRLNVRVLQTAAGTAQSASLAAYRLTGFTAVDTTNTTTPVPSLKRTGMGASPGNVAIRGVTVAGAAAGMTGGTLVKDTNNFGLIPFLVAVAAPTTNAGFWGPHEFVDGNSWTVHPFVLAQNEGFDLENVSLNTTSYGCQFYVHLDYAEVAAY